MQNRMSGTHRRSLIAVCLLALTGLLAVASAAHDTQIQRPKPPPTYVPSNHSGQIVHLSQQFRYRGGHPIHPDYGQGWCAIQPSHTHVYPPFEPELFCASGGEFVFIGDPADFQYDGPVHWYANPHPMDDEHGGDWCHYPWPHRHAFAMSGDAFNLVAGIVYFIGDFTQAFFKLFRHKRRFFRRHYRPRYLRGRVYRGNPRRYVRVGPGRYRMLTRRPTRGFQPYRPSMTRRPDRIGSLTRRPDRIGGLTRRPDRIGGLTRRPNHAGRLIRRPHRPTGLTRRGLPRRWGGGSGLVVRDPRTRRRLRRLPRFPHRSWARRMRRRRQRARRRLAGRRRGMRRRSGRWLRRRGGRRGFRSRLGHSSTWSGSRSSTRSRSRSGSRSSTRSSSSSRRR